MQETASFLLHFLCHQCRFAALEPLLQYAIFVAFNVFVFLSRETESDLLSRISTSSAQAGRLRA
jgi:hypothetical protein